MTSCVSWAPQPTLVSWAPSRAPQRDFETPSREPALAEGSRGEQRAHLQEGFLEDEPDVEVALVGPRGPGVLDGAHGPGGARRGALGRFEVQVDPKLGAASASRHHAIAEQARHRQQDPVDVVALGAPLPAPMALLDPPDHAAEGLRREYALVEERRELVGELLPEPLLELRG